MSAIALASLVAVVTVVGGLLPLVPRFKRIELRYLVGFAAGVMISTAFFEIIPEVGEFTFLVSMFFASGFFILYVVEKSIMIHGCDEHECEIHTPIGWVSLIGIGAESLVDGMAIAVGFKLSVVLGLTIAAAVASHELPRGFSTTVIMRNSNYGMAAVVGALLIDSLLTPVGAALAYFFPPSFFNYIVAFTAGTFVYVGAADLLPQAHERFNAKVVGAVLAGSAWIPAVVYFFKG